MEDTNCSLAVEMTDVGSGANSPTQNIVTQLLLIPIFVISLIGNTCTIAIISSFKKQRVPDVLVLGIAMTDLLATFVPVPMSIYSYVTEMSFPECSPLCVFYATIAQFTRYSSALIFTVIAVERYLAICTPFFYRSHCSPRLFWLLLLLSWLVACILALPPALDESTRITSSRGFCLFDFTTAYAIVIIVYALVQFLVVLVCFVRVTVELLRVKRRRRRMSSFRRASSINAARQKKGIKPVAQSPGLVSRISDLGKSIKTAAPALSGKLQLGAESQFLRMFAVVVFFFYLSWLPIVVSVVCVYMCMHSSCILVTSEHACHCGSCVRTLPQT